MQILFDNLAAMIIATTILLMLVAVQQRNQEVAVDAISQEALWKQQVSFVRNILRRDMAGVTKVEDFEAKLTDGNEFTFHTRHETGSSEIEVTYKCLHVKTLADGTKLYQIERLVGPPGSRSSDGGSGSTITAWSVAALNEDGNPPSKSEEVRQIHVEVEAVAPFKAGNSERRSQHWEATYRPVQLRGDKIL